MTSPNVVRDRDDLPATEEIFSRVLERRDLDRLAGHLVIADSLRDMSSLARLGATFEDAAATTDPLPWAPALGPRPPDPADE